MTNRDSGNNEGMGPVRIDLDSPLASILPFEVENVHDLVAEYDSILDYFRGWPRYPDVGTLTTGDGRKIEFYSEVTDWP
jgi:hypothetical protein